MATLDVVGWFGGTLLALCGAPQAWKSFNTKSSTGISKGFLTMWFFGEILCLCYTVSITPTPWPLIINYLINIVFVIIIGLYLYE